MFPPTRQSSAPPLSTEVLVPLRRHAGSKIDLVHFCSSVFAGVCFLQRGHHVHFVQIYERERHSSCSGFVPFSIASYVSAVALTFCWFAFCRRATKLHKHQEQTFTKTAHRIREPIPLLNRLFDTFPFILS